MAGSFDDNLVYISRLLEGILDKQSSIDPMSQSAYNKLLDNFSAQIGKLNDASNVTKAELKNIIAYFKTFVSSYDLKSTEFNKTVQQLQRSLEGRMAGGEKLNVDKLLKGLSNLFTSAVLQSIKAEERGKTGTFKNVVDNEKLQVIIKDLAQRMGVQSDASANKIIEYFKEQEKKKEKRERGYVDDLIEGLEKSKWVGGALRDTFALIGLLGANWLSHFGSFGRKVGGAFYVAMITAGPILTQMLMKGLGGVLKNTLPMLKEFLFPGGQNVGNMLGAGLGFAGAMWAAHEYKDSERRGMKGNAQAFKYGGATMAAGGLALGTAAVATSVAGVAGGSAIGGVAAAIAAAMGPIGWALLGIGAGIAGLAFLWKHHSDTIKKWAKKFGEFVGKVIDFMALFNPVFTAIKWLKDNWEHRPTWLGGDGGAGTVGGRSANYKFGSSATGAELLNVTNKGGHIDKSKVTEEMWQSANTLQATYGDLGQITNLGKMTKQQAARVISEDIKKKGNKSFYEYVTDDSIVDKKSFGTDVADDGGVYLARGVVEEFMKFKEKLEKAGFDTSNMKITSGIGSLGNFDTREVSPHTYSDSIKGHFSSLGTTIDTTAIFNKATGARLSQADMDRLGYGTWYLYNKGADHATHEHLSMKMIPYQQQIKGEMKEIDKAQKVAAMTSTADLLKFYDEDKYNEITRKFGAGGWTPKSIMDKHYKDALKEEGAYISDTAGKPWMYTDEQGRPQLIKSKDGGIFFTDPTGIHGYRDAVVQNLANSGTGGS